MENNPRLAQLTPEQRDQTLALQIKFATIGGAATIVIGLPVYYLVASAILLGIVAGIMSAPVRFKQL